MGDNLDFSEHSIPLSFGCSLLVLAEVFAKTSAHFTHFVEAVTAVEAWPSYQADGDDFLEE